MKSISISLGRFYNAHLISGFIILGSIIVFSIVGLKTLSHINPYKIRAYDPNLPPNNVNLLGTNALGRDMFTGILLSTLNSLLIGIIGAGIGVLIGILVGASAAYFGGKLDHILRILTDTFLVIPMLPVMILIGSILRWNVLIMGVSFVIFTWAWSSRTIRSQILSLKRRDFIELARLSGMSEIKILFIEILPHLIPWILSSLIYAIMWVMINETGLSFLGLGPTNDITFGTMIYWAFKYGSLYRGIWWAWAPVVVMLSLIFISLYTISVGFDKISRGT
ncbi:MAG: ABC transporter permease [Candidatus Bathyarchaeia archaeon]